VQDQIGLGQPREALVRETPPPARQMRVRDDRDARQRTGAGAAAGSSRKRPARQTSSPSA
jgi:hypothetical protein